MTIPELQLITCTHQHLSRIKVVILHHRKSNAAKAVNLFLCLRWRLAAEGLLFWAVRV